VKWVAAIASALLLGGAAGADTLGSVERVCPFTGKKFSGRIDTSATHFCVRLDLKPIGATGAPPELPVCPDDGFIVFKETFTGAELERLRPWVRSDEFRIMTANESTYYRYAETLRRLGQPSKQIAWRLVQASWQVDNDREKYARYATAAVKELEALAADPNMVLLAAELERRTGRFDGARAKLERLQKQTGVSDGARAQLERELQFVAEHDSTRHYMQLDEERCKELD
jgi:hypothetical protein